MTRFDTFIIIDWSGGNDTGATPRKDAIWVGVTRNGASEEPLYFRNRNLLETWLSDRLKGELATSRRVCVGFDFPFGYPAGFAQAVTGKPDTLALWDWFADQVEDTPTANNRFDLAGQVNQKFDGIGPFWGNGLKRDIDDLPRLGSTRTCAKFAEKRQVEQIAKGSFSCWQLSGAGAVGSQVIMGMPVLSRLRRSFGPKLKAWPFEDTDNADIVLAEIYPSLLKDQVSAAVSGGGIKDSHQVRILADALTTMDKAGSLGAAFTAGAESTQEGWILGVGAEEALLLAASPALPKPPKFEDNCFALPPGVSWMPVDDALAGLDAALLPVTNEASVNYMRAAGRVLSRDLVARRSNPPAANSAVDGYGFAHETLGSDGQAIPLAQGRAAAGQPFTKDVPAGHAIRILTGAILPQGVDTVVLEEDCSLTETHIAFAGPIKKGANARKAGEDVGAGDSVFVKSHRVQPQDVALIAALGIDIVPVFESLAVGVLSTGDELVAPGDAQHPHQTCDANRPMLLSMLTRWGYDAVDLGHVNDERSALKKRLNEGAAKCDAILTSGGASAGDEDHVSALLSEAGTLHSWRIALKPGRPLALAHWQDTPIFGLPGNPVAAFVCALIFGAPALSKLSGAGWQKPRGYLLPARFTKSKKQGRREYLRARINDEGHVETFASEGSGRISGLSWSDGLVELPDGAADISPGDMVRYIPYSNFGL